jgi:glycosyltransferase involved in cell wall biosynthesis
MARKSWSTVSLSVCSINGPNARASVCEIVALVHHPLALETGLDAEQRQDLAASERQALAWAEHVIVTSPMTARELTSSYNVPSEKITVAIPGTEPGALASCEGEPAHIVSIGTLIPRKGHDVLIAALKRIEHLSWTATIVGSHDLSPKTTREILVQLAESGLAKRVSLAGEVADVRPVLASADIFALASRFEGYGMVFAEALSHGLPIVACRTSAVPDVVPEEAGILTGVDDIDAFAAALGSLVTNRGLRRAQSRSGPACGRSLAETGTGPSTSSQPDWRHFRERFRQGLAGAERNGRSGRPRRGAGGRACDLPPVDGPSVHPRYRLRYRLNP